MSSKGQKLIDLEEKVNELISDMVLVKEILIRLDSRIPTRQKGWLWNGWNDNEKNENNNKRYFILDK
tara:strand:+ start:472 stop:672 length:201 start_codon:yes stop_codon:yes gene_type:complete